MLVANLQPPPCSPIPIQCNLQRGDGAPAQDCNLQHCRSTSKRPRPLSSQKLQGWNHWFPELKLKAWDLKRFALFVSSTAFIHILCGWSLWPKTILWWTCWIAPFTHCMPAGKGFIHVAVDGCACPKIIKNWNLIQNVENLKNAVGTQKTSFWGIKYLLTKRQKFNHLSKRQVYIYTVYNYMILYVDITRVSQPQSKSLMPSIMVWFLDMVMFLRNWCLNWTYRHHNTTASHHASHRSPLFPGDAGPFKDCRVGVVYLQINSTTCFANDPGRLQHFDHHIKSIHSLVERNGNG